MAGILGLVSVALHRRRDAAVGLLLLPLLIKPHLVWAALLYILGSSLRQGRWRVVAAFAAGALLLLLGSVALDPTWINQWRASGTPAAWMTFSFPDLLTMLFGLPPATRYAGLAVGLPLAALVTWRARRFEQRTFCAMLILSWLTSPYVWNHDLMVLAPIWLWIWATLLPHRPLRPLLLALSATMILNGSPPIIASPYFVLATQLTLLALLILSALALWQSRTGVEGAPRYLGAPTP